MIAGYSRILAVALNEQKFETGTKRRFVRSSVQAGGCDLRPLAVSQRSFAPGAEMHEQSCRSAWLNMSRAYPAFFVPFGAIYGICR
jgi:hypothetical protein